MKLVDEYMRGPYPKQKSEIRHLDNLISEVLPVFNAFYLKNGWPYEIMDEKSIERQRNLSYSTSSMIMFTVALSIGLLKRSSMFPLSNWQDRLANTSYHLNIQKRRDLEDTLIKAFEEVVDKSVNKYGLDARRPVFYSESFGDDDPFTLSWFTELVANAHYEMSNGKKLEDSHKDFERFKTKVAKRSYSMLKEAFKNPQRPFLKWKSQSQRRTHKSSVDHAFPLLRAVYLYNILRNINHARSPKIPYDDLRQSLLEKVRPHFLGFVHQHLSFHDITNSAFDAAELVFSLEGLLLIDGESMSVEKHLLDRVFQVIRERQKISPYWRPLKPFVTTPQGLALLPLSVEIANSLLRICDLLDSEIGEHTHFSENIELFQRYAGWLYTRVIRGSAKFDNKFLKPFAGWHSEHVHIARKIHPWETSQVMIFLMHYRPLLQDHIAGQLVAEANVSAERIPRDKPSPGFSSSDYWRDYWERKGEPLNGSVGANSTYLVLKHIREQYLEPRENGFSSFTGELSYSILLYGPPGTGKTTIAEELAKALRWPLITITPSDFIASGEAEVEARAKMIFNALGEQRDMVILFDEIDQLILNRESARYREQGDIFKCITPGMLPKLRDLRSKKRSIFIVATNYEERIDTAAKRSGRIDHQFFVSLPGRKKRFQILKSLIEKRLKEKWIGQSSEQESITNDLNMGILEQIVNRTVLFTYGEMSQLVASAVDKFFKLSSLRNARVLCNFMERALQNHQEVANRISLYINRFNLSGEKDFPDEIEPYEEFFLIVYLVCEARNLTEDEKGIIKRVVERRLEVIRSDMSGGISKDSITEALQGVISDDDIRQKLHSKICKIMGIS